MMSTRASGLLRLSMSAVAAPENAPPDDRDVTIEIHRHKDDGLCRS
jgi:hypothetical protein